MAKPRIPKTDAAAISDRDISAVIPACPPLPPGELGEATEHAHHHNLVDFMNAIETARAVWKECPQFVTAENLDAIPAEAWTAFQKEYARCIDCAPYKEGRFLDGFQGDILLTPDYADRLRARAEESLSEEAAKQQAKNPAIETSNGCKGSWFDTDDLEYTLEMDHGLVDGNNLEEIAISRDEYIAAKALVAKMRGIVEEAEEKAA